MSLTNRRTFMMQVAVGSTALATSSVMAQAPAMVAETDANAVALGYKADTTKVDKAKYPAHKPTANCANCALYQGKPGDAGGNCPLFAGKQVHAKGWCSAYAPKAA
jgi:hypothetical protein